jgi:hypothetical protein
MTPATSTVAANVDAARTDQRRVADRGMSFPSWITQMDGGHRRPGVRASDGTNQRPPVHGAAAPSLLIRLCARKPTSPMGGGDAIDKTIEADERVVNGRM